MRISRSCSALTRFLPQVQFCGYGRRCAHAAMRSVLTAGYGVDFWGPCTQVQGWEPCPQGHGSKNQVLDCWRLWTDIFIIHTVCTSTSTRLRQVCDPFLFVKRSCEAWTSPAGDPQLVESHGDDSRMRPCLTPSSGCSSVTATLAKPTTGTDVPTGPRTITRTSTTLSMNCGWSGSTVFCVSQAVGTCLCVTLSVDGLAHVGPTSPLRRSLPESTVALLAHRQSVRRFTLGYAPPGNKRELRLRTTVFAGAVNVTQRTTWLTFLQRILKRKPLGPSLSKTACFLFSVVSWAERSFLSVLISLYFVMQSSCCFLQCLGNWDIDGRVNVLKQWDIHRSRRLLNQKHLSLHHHWNVLSVLFQILLGCGTGLPLVERHRGYL